MTNNTWSTEQITDQTGRIIIVTGSTSGIGRETARVLASKGATVIIAARNESKAQRVIAEIKQEQPEADLHLLKLDLTSLASIKNFATQFQKKFQKLDVLINNAGVMVCPEGQTEDGFELQMGTNHLGHFALTLQLLPMIRRSTNARIVVLSSYAHHFGNLQLDDLNWQQRKYKRMRAYGDSKVANLYFAYELARKLKADNSDIRVTAAHPGWTATELQRHTSLTDKLNRWFAQGVDMGAQPTLRAGFDDSAQSGDFFGPSKYLEMHGAPKKVSSNAKSRDTLIASKLWDLSEQLTGVQYH